MPHSIVHVPVDLSTVNVCISVSLPSRQGKMFWSRQGMQAICAMRLMYFVERNTTIALPIPADKWWRFQRVEHVQKEAGMENAVPLIVAKYST